MSLVAREQLQEEIDEAILQLPKCIGQLAIHSRSPISDLPVEILSNVFVMCTQESVSDLYQLISITHVCRHWRAVAVENPLLWTRIPFIEQADLYYEFLSRSKDLPLHLAFTSQTARELPAFAATLLSTNLHKVKTLTLSLYDSDSTLFLQQTDEHAPVLETLHYSCGGSWLFDGRAPNLREVSVRQCRVNWNWLPFAHITKLQVRNAYPYISLSVLRKLPQLQYLESPDPLPQCPSRFQGEVPTSDLVYLKHLRQIKLLNSSFSGYSFFLNHLRYPPTAHIDLLVQTRIDYNDIFRSSIPPFLPPASHVDIATHRNASAWFFTTSNVKMEVALYQGLGTYCLYTPLRILSAGASIESLRLDMDDYGTPEFFANQKFQWSNILSFLPQVKRIDLNLTTFTRNLLSWLANGRKSRPRFLPLLRSLGVSLKGFDEILASEDLLILRETLKNRKERKCMISEARLTTNLQIVSGEISVLINEMSSLVGAFEWENREVSSVI